MAKIVDNELVFTKDDICGVGWFKDDDPDLIPACRTHDVMYQYYKNRNILSRKDIDKIFYDQVVKSKKTFFGKTKAFLYYGLVRAFGWVSWLNKSNAL